MEGEGSKPLPEEGASKGSSMKLIAAIIVVILIVAAIGGALLLMGGKAPENQAPTARLATLSEIVDSGTAVTLNASASSDPDGSIASYVWWFGDGTTMTTQTATVSHAYYLPGSYLAVVQVIDDKGASGYSWSSSVSVTVNPFPTPEVPANGSAPVPIMASSDQSITTGDTINFNGNSTFGYATGGSTQPSAGENIATLIWQFGDGVSISDVYANDSLANHTYVAPNGAVYLASLTAISTHDTVATTYMTVVVKPVQSAAGGVKNPDTFIKATFGEPQSLDPAWDYESAGGEVLQATYETLVTYNGSSASELVPLLATEIPTLANGGISPDGMNYTFNLRANVQFHSGGVMTADDVVFSIKRCLFMNDAQGPAWMLAQCMLPSYTGLGTVVNPAEVNAAVEKTGTMQVTFHLFHPYAAFMYILAYTACSIMSESFVLANSPDGVLNGTNGGVTSGTQTDYFNTHECGTGPFTLKQWAVNQQIILQRFANYWREPAALKYVIIKKVQDTSTREMMMLSGQADYIDLAAQFKDDLTGKAGVSVITGLPTLAVNFFGPNEDIKPGLDVGDIPSNFFADVNVRLAFVHAFDYDNFITQISQNLAVRASQPIPPGLFGYNASIPLYDYNLTKVADYLKLAPDTRPGHTGSYADNGFHIVLYYNEGNTGRQAGCAYMKQALETISANPVYGVTGHITVDINAMSWPAYLDARAAGSLPMFFMGWTVDYPDPDDFVAPFCDQNGSFPIFLGLHNDTLTGLVHQAAASADPTVRAALYTQISLSCYDNAYYLWTTVPTNLNVLRTWVQGWFYNPTYPELPGNYYVLSKALPT